VLSVTVRPADEEISEKLGLPQKAEVVEVCRIRLSNGEPLSHEQAYLPLSRLSGIENVDFKRSIYEILRTDYAIEPQSTTERIEVVGASRENAGLLDVKSGSPLFFITRWTVDTKGEGVEFSRDFFRVDRTQLYVHSTRT
jgi:GntR family transcriptional regulator